MEYLQHTSPRILSRKQALFAAALALFSRMPDGLAASGDPELETASAKMESLEARAKETSGRVAQADVQIMQAQTALELAQTRFKKKRTPAAKQALAAAEQMLAAAEEEKRRAVLDFESAEEELAAAKDRLVAIIELKTAEATLRAAQEKARTLGMKQQESVAKPEASRASRPTAKTTSSSSSPIGIAAGSTFSLFSSGDNPVQSPGVFGRVNLKVPGITRAKGSTVEIEGSYADFDEALSDTHADFEPRDSTKRLDGDMVNFSVGAGLDVPLAASDAVGANFHLSANFGTSVLYIDGGTDVAVAKKSDAQGRRPLANMPSRILVFPHTAMRAEISVVTRDNISGALGGYVMLASIPTQNRAADPDRSQTPFFDSGLRASLGYQF